MLDDVLLSRRCEIRLDRIIRRLSAECHHDPRGDALLDEQISPSSGGGRDSRRAGSRDLPFPQLLSRPRARPSSGSFASAGRRATRRDQDRAPIRTDSRGLRNRGVARSFAVFPCRTRRSYPSQRRPRGHDGGVGHSGDVG